jgi:hypothetical protein
MFHDSLDSIDELLPLGGVVEYCVKFVLILNLDVVGVVDNTLVNVQLGEVGVTRLAEPAFELDALLGKCPVKDLLDFQIA